jgi:nitrogen-specific signal transduction histidine kinase
MQTRMRVQEELRQSQKMEALGHLTGGVAHDFNNLLAVVLGNLELLAHRLDADSQESAFAGEATSAAERAAALTQRLLVFSRKQRLTPRPIDARALLEGMRAMLESTLSEAIRVEIRAQEDLWHCMADSAQLENAILNLVINARDAMSAGGRVVLEASNLTLDPAGAAAHSDARAGSYVAISVRDSGAGIPPEVLPRVFDPFFTTKEVGAGSGLGLSMVYGFARQSGGFVSLESEVDLGTQVQICLPRIQAAEAAGGAEDSDAPSRGNGESVLLVEDEPTVRKLLVSILEGLDYAVTPVEDGSEALAILHENDPVDVILSDVVLPGVYSGPDLIREVARRRPGVKAVLMSGYASEVLESSESPLEHVKLLHKPFKKGELARTLRAVLDGR